jgi:hypothetical protein
MGSAIMAAERDLLQQLAGDPEPERLGLEEVRVDQRRRAARLAPLQPADERERHAPGQVGRDEAAEQRPDRRGDRRCRADQRVRLRLRGAFEVAVDERLHRRQQQRRAEPADDRPEDHDRDQVLGERHRHGAGRVAEQAEHVRALAPEHVADTNIAIASRSGSRPLRGSGCIARR